MIYLFAIHMRVLHDLLLHLLKSRYTQRDLENDVHEARVAVGNLSVKTSHLRCNVVAMRDLPLRFLILRVSKFFCTAVAEWHHSLALVPRVVGSIP